MLAPVTAPVTFRARLAAVSAVTGSLNVTWKRAVGVSTGSGSRRVIDWTVGCRLVDGHDLSGR